MQLENAIILIKSTVMSGKMMTACSFTANRTPAKQFCYIQGNPRAKGRSKVQDFKHAPHNHNICVKIVNGNMGYTQKVSELKTVFSKPASLPVVGVLTKKTAVLALPNPCFGIPTVHKHPFLALTLVPLDFTFR